MQKVFYCELEIQINYIFVENRGKVQILSRETYATGFTIILRGAGSV